MKNLKTQYMDINNLIKTWAQDLNTHQEDMQMVNMYIKQCSISHYAIVKLKQEDITTFC